MSKKNESLPLDAKGWIERIQLIDYRDHKTAAITLGSAAAIGIGVGSYMLSKRHGEKPLHIRFADRRAEANGVVSIVEEGRNAKYAVGLPTFDTDLEPHQEFSMDEDGGTVRPVMHADRVPTHVSRLKKTANYLVALFADRLEDGPAEQVTEPQPAIEPETL